MSRVLHCWAWLGLEEKTTRPGDFHGKLSLNNKIVLEEEDMLYALVERRERESMRGKVFQVVDL